ncbi:MAG TPA: ABC transporter substrate-binding protein, partial [Ktedonobacterales bacterium]|nr:ABC transporter substrate-binding protein [Ktedonobacterales bacterium]
MVDTNCLTSLRVNTFRGLQNLPLYVAHHHGFFAEQRLRVEVSYTTGSTTQLARLARGDYELIQTAPDNVIHFDHDPDAFGVPVNGAPRVVMLLGGSNGPLSVYARPGVSSYDKLRGASLGVDNPSSGFALVLRDLLLRAGLRLDHDYTFVVMGSTQMRLDALLRGDIAATILYMPFDQIAAVHGCHRLAVSTDHYPAYASLATAGRQPWI